MIPLIRLAALLCLCAGGAAAQSSAPVPVAPVAAAPRPARPEEGHLTVEAKNLARRPGARITVLTDLGDAGAEAPLLAAKEDGLAARYLRRLGARGQAAGLAGVLYDNRDRGHSRMHLGRFPQLTPIRYGETLVARGLDYGLAGGLAWDPVVLGNSSTAFTSGRAPRSLPRHAMTVAPGPERAWQGYASNEIYVYPEHRDHDAVDLYPANWPYMVISQGSSRSDKPFLDALAMTLAAFRPDTRARLEEEGLVAPTLQRILRRSQRAVRSREAYLSGAAHPTVFAGDALQPARMIGLANAIAPDAIPPLVRLDVMGETFRDAAGLDGRSEKLFDTPSAIARLWRGREYSRQISLSAAGTEDPNGRDLRFHWVLLRGAPEHARIETFGHRGAIARITLDWQERHPAGPRSERQSDRVDIGIFADNGAYLSAPAVLSVTFPTHQRRDYEPGPDGAMRLARIDYDARGRDRGYDPLLWWSAPWTDVFAYAPEGGLTGWTRRHADGRAPERFRADGRRADGTAVTYTAARRGGAAPVLDVAPAAAGDDSTLR